MGKAKYYAVRQGRKPGIYRTWSECQEQVLHYPKAQYKSFATESEAHAYLSGESRVGASADSSCRLSLAEVLGLSDDEPKEDTRGTITVMGTIVLGRADYRPELVSAKTSNEAGPSMIADKIEAYVDGSFNKGAGIVGSGAVIFYQWKKEALAFRTGKGEFTAYWNVSGELLATVEVVRRALDRGVSFVDLYYDYEGIEKWATGAWKRNNPLTQAYEAFMKEAKKSVSVRFHKVRAHTGDRYNEEADRLAKLGAGM